MVIGNGNLHQQIHILYIDDNPFDRELVRDALEREHGGFRITEAASRSEFEALLGEGGYDLVLSDFHIQGFEALDVMDTIRVRKLDLPVVIVTGTGSEQVAVEAMKQGAADYVIKTPHHIQRLPATILAAMEKHRLQKAHVRAEEEQSLLVEASRLLASSLDYETTLSKVLRLTIPLLGDSCVLYLFSEDPPRNLLVHSVDPAKEELARRFWCSYRPSSEVPDPMWMAMNTGRPQLLSQVSPEVLSAMAGNGEEAALLVALEPMSLLAVPLIAREKPIGGLLFVRSTPAEPYSAQDLPIAEELAQRVALAIDNSRLYRAATEAVRARDEFLSEAAHELKTPVTSLKGFAQLTIRQIDRHGMPDPLQLREAMRVIEQESAKLSLLVARLLDVSRIEAHRLQLDTRPTDLAALLEEVVTRVRVASQRSITLARPLSLMVMADPLRIEQVITNLLDNAIKYSPDDEQVEVDLWTTVPDRTCLSVRDHGIGIPPERRRRIFDRFYRAHDDANYGGMGLGLYISHHIVELHGGRIDVEFPSDGGTRFVVTLPTCLSSVPSPTKTHTA